MENAEIISNFAKFYVLQHIYTAIVVLLYVVKIELVIVYESPRRRVNRLSVTKIDYCEI